MGFNVVPTEQEIEDIEAKTLQDKTDKEILRWDNLNKRVFMDLILSININTTTS